MQDKNMKINATISLEAEDEILIQRLIQRGKESGRSDDIDESKIRNRFDEYNQKTAPLIDYYQKQNKYVAVNGIGSIDDIAFKLEQIVADL